MALTPEQDIQRIMEIKKITYLGDFENPRLPDKDILYSLRKIAKVKAIDVRKFNLKRAIKDVLGCDLFLFHGQMPNAEDKATYWFIIDRLRVLLQGSNAKKVLWLFDKIWGEKINMILEFANAADYIFVNDGTWLKRFETDNIFPMKQAASNISKRGKFKKEFACDIAYFGDIYGNRENEVKFLKERFGGRMKVFNNKFGRDLADLCKSAKVIVCPMYPFDDFYWSDRIYKILSYGGFVLHPRNYGLELEGFVDGKHYMTYNSEQELVISLEMLLDKKADKSRKAMQKAGKEFVMENHTYKQRIEKIYERIKENNN
jgi:Glycosyl transferases group 1